MATTVSVRTLGRTGPKVFPVALGCMGMSGIYGATDEAESAATIQAAVDAGVTLFDTGDFYGMGQNETLLNRALGSRRNQVLLSVKFGALRGPDGSWLGHDARPTTVKTSLAYSLQRLGTDHIDIYRPARLDPAVPIEETVGAIAEMVKAGYVRYIGLSEVGAETIRRAAAVHPIVDLQIEYSLISRGPEEKIFPVLDELGVATTAYSVLSRGMLTGSQATGPQDVRTYYPRFQGANAEHNRRASVRLREMAAGRGVTPAQLAIAWVLAKRESIVAVIGARTRRQLADTVAAIDMKLSAEEVAELEAAIRPADAAGGRYSDEQMRHLDSEK